MWFGVLLVGLVSPSGGLAAVPPSNDQIANATPISSIPFYHVVHDGQATSQPQDLSCNPPDGHSIWFTVKPRPAATSPEPRHPTHR